MGLQRLQVVEVDRDPGLLHPAQERHERQLDVSQQFLSPVFPDGLVEGTGEIEHRSGVHHRRGRDLRTQAAVVIEEGCLVTGRVLLQLATQVTQGQVRQVVAALIGTHQVGRQRGVAGDPVDRPAVGGQSQRGPLGVVQDLGSGGVGEPVAQGLVVLGRQGLGVDVRRGVGGGGDRHSLHAAGAAAPRAAHV